MKRWAGLQDPATCFFWVPFLFHNCVTRGTEQCFALWGQSPAL